MNIQDIRVRDPYIVLWNDVYYLYNSKNPLVPETVEVRRSRDLCNWDEPTTVYTLDTSTWKKAELWAPEIHVYHGKFYMFLSILGKNGLRGTEISVADTPEGPFLPIADRPATPLDQSAIDGTLFVEDGIPYIVYSRDWPHCFDAGMEAYVGEIRAQALSDDLTTPIGEDFCLFRSCDCPASAAAPTRVDWEELHGYRYGSDAPFVMRLPGGKLLLTWSPIPGGNYVVLCAVSDSLRSPWKHVDKPLYDRHGGHAMFFTDRDGKLKMALHGPEIAEKERTLIFDITLTEDGAAITGEK